jgi:tetratricopeptide (TPR) repeat protein
VTQTKYKSFLALVLFVLSSSPVLAQDSLWKTYIDAGTAAYEAAKTTSNKDDQAKRYADAERRFSLARKEAEDFGPQDPRLAMTLCKLALVYVNQDKVPDAKSLFTQALRIWDGAHWGKSWGTEPLETSNTILKFAGDLISKNQFDDTELLLTQALKIQTASLKSEHANIGRIHYYLAITNYRQKKAPEAASHIREAISIYEKARDTIDHKEIIDALRYASVIDPEQAEVFLNRALEFREQNLEPEYFDIDVLSLLADVYGKQQKYSKREWALTRMIKTTRRSYGLNDIRVASGVKVLADSYLQVEDFAKAEAGYKEGLAELAQVTGDTRGLRFQLSNGLQIVYQRMGRYAEAEPLVEQCLKIVEDVLGTKDLFYATYLTTQGLLLLNRKRYADAELKFKQALTLQEGKLKEDDPDLNDGPNNLAKAYYYQGKYDQAEPLYLRVIAATQKLQNPSAVTLARYQKNYALLLYALGKDDQAEPLFRQSLDVFTRNHEENRVSFSWFELAELYHRQKNYSKAEPLYQTALKLMDRPGQDRVDLALALEKYASLLRETNRESEAAQPETRAKTIRSTLAGKP